MEIEIVLHWLILTASIVTAIFGQVMLKNGSARETFMAQIFDGNTIAGLATYIFSAILYIIALRSIPISIALPFTSISYIGVALIGHFTLNEPLNEKRIIGLSLIGGGVVFLATS